MDGGFSGNLEGEGASEEASPLAGKTTKIIASPDEKRLMIESVVKILKGEDP